MTPDGVGEVIDFMPIEDPRSASERHRLVRAVRCVRGQIRFVLECSPRFDYGRQSHDLEVTEEGAVFRTPELQLTLHGPAGLERDGDDVHATMTLQAGQVDGVVLESAADTGPVTWRLLSCWRCSTRPRCSGGGGWPARPTAAVGERWSTVRP